MGINSGTMGSLLQGVSQQPDRIRLQGQVSEQVNLVSDVTRGLSTRPGTAYYGELAASTPVANYTDIVFQGTPYVVGYTTGFLKLWDVGGSAPVERPVTVIDTDALDYIGPNCRFHVVDNDGTPTIVVVNRDKLVQKVDFVPASKRYTVLFHALGGQFMHTYRVEVTAGTGLIDAEYTTPDGDSPGDAAQTTSEYIAEQLYDQILGHENLPSDAVVTRAGDVVSVSRPGGQFLRIVTEDGAGGEVLRAVGASVKDATHLPRFAPNGTIVRVTMSSAEEDDYYLKFTTEAGFPENGTAGMGREGRWVEWHNPDEDREFNLTTMPHVITWSAANNRFELRRGPWIGRPVGDSKSAPFASIVGKPIRDINGFESRLALLSTSTVCMSRTNHPFDLWRNSATTKAATDPLDFTSTKKNDLSLDWLVPLERDLYVIADPGDSQFVIRGGGVTAGNISMVLTTEYEVSSDPGNGGNLPIPSTGKTLLLPFQSGTYSGLNEFYTNTENSQTAVKITENIPRYILGSIKQSEVSQTHGLCVVRATPADTLYVYKYLWDADRLVQSSWGKWTFKNDILYVWFSGVRLYIVYSHNSGHHVQIMDLDRLAHIPGTADYHITLDNTMSSVTDSDSGGVFVEYPWEYPGETPTFLVAMLSPYRLIEVQPVSNTGSKWYFDPEVVPAFTDVICGQKIPWKLTPTQVFAKDHRDVIDTNRKVTIQEYEVHVNNSGEFIAEGTSKFMEPWEYDPRIFPIDYEPEFLSTESATSDDVVVIPWGLRADMSTFTLKGDDFKSVDIVEITWNGQITSHKGRRVA